MSFNVEGFISISDVADGAAGVGTTVKFYYTSNAGTSSEVGDPSTPGAGVTWVSFNAGDSIPTTAQWLARREKSGAETVFSSWILIPLANAQNILPFVSYTVTGAEAPTLGDSTWVTHVLEAASQYTGRAFTQLKAMGFGSVFVISYPNNTGGAVKVFGKYVEGDPSWVSSVEFIDGDLLVDGTIAADKIQANAITVGKISAGAVLSDNLGDEAVTSGKIESNAVTSAKILIDAPVSIVSTGGSINSGISSFPTNLDNFSGRGVWMGVDNDGLSKFIVGESGRFMGWDGDEFQIRGRLLTDSNIVSIDGNSVSTQTFRVSSADKVDNGAGSVTGGSRSGSGITGTNSSTDVEYEFFLSISATEIGKHYYVSINTGTNSDTYNLDNGSIVLEAGVNVPGVNQSLYDSPTGGFMYEKNGGTSARYAGDRETKAGTTSPYMYVDITRLFVPIRKTITFDSAGIKSFRVTMLATAGITPSWSALSLDAYASGREEFKQVAASSGGTTLTFEDPYESVENIQITPTADVRTWLTNRGTSSVKIHSSSNNTVDVRVIGY